MWVGSQEDDVVVFVHKHHIKFLIVSQALEDVVHSVVLLAVATRVNLFQLFKDVLPVHLLLVLVLHHGADVVDNVGHGILMSLFIHYKNS